MKCRVRSRRSTRRSPTVCNRSSMGCWPRTPLAATPRRRWPPGPWRGSCSAERRPRPPAEGPPAPYAMDRGAGAGRGRPRRRSPSRSRSGRSADPPYSQAGGSQRRDGGDCPAAPAREGKKPGRRRPPRDAFPVPRHWRGRPRRRRRLAVVEGFSAQREERREGATRTAATVSSALRTLARCSCMKGRTEVQCSGRGTITDRGIRHAIGRRSEGGLPIQEGVRQ